MCREQDCRTPFRFSILVKSKHEFEANRDNAFHLKEVDKTASFSHWGCLITANEGPSYLNRTYTTLQWIQIDLLAANKEKAPRGKLEQLQRARAYQPVQVDPHSTPSPSNRGTRRQGRTQYRTWGAALGRHSPPLSSPLGKKESGRGRERERSPSNKPTGNGP